MSMRRRGGGAPKSAWADGQSGEIDGRVPVPPGRAAGWNQGTLALLRARPVAGIVLAPTVTTNYSAVVAIAYSTLTARGTSPGRRTAAGPVPRIGSTRRRVRLRTDPVAFQ